MVDNMDRVNGEGKGTGAGDTVWTLGEKVGRERGKLTWGEKGDSASFLTRMDRESDSVVNYNNLKEWLVIWIG